MNLLARKRENGETKYVKTAFRKCTKKDFEDIGYKMDPTMVKSYEDRFCPESDIKEHIHLKNGYSNPNRLSF